MLRTRLLSTIVYLPIVVGALALGGWWYWALVTMVLSVGCWEYQRLMHLSGHRVWLPATLGLVWLLMADAAVPSWLLVNPGLTFFLLASLTWAMTRFNRGDADPVGNWALGLVGGLYLGWIGAHLIRLRDLPLGLYWSVIAFGSTWLADSGAYLIGKAWGRRKMASRLSPGKTWEGYLAGVVVGTLFTGGLAALFGLGGWHGLALGFLIACLSPIGDLGISLLKRQAQVKDSGSLIPGHGGALDRVDSLLVSAVIATYYVIWVVH